jgi:hypothetical protein
MKKKAQSILEYILIVGIVGMALGAMQLYFRRTVQSAIKIAADELGDQQDAQEIDPVKGAKMDSQIHRYPSGAAASSAVLNAGDSQRTRAIGIEIPDSDVWIWQSRTDVDKIVTSTGYSVSVSDKEGEE